MGGGGVFFFTGVWQGGGVETPNISIDLFLLSGIKCKYLQKCASHWAFKINNQSTSPAARNPTFLPSAVVADARSVFPQYPLSRK